MYLNKKNNLAGEYAVPHLTADTLVGRGRGRRLIPGRRKEQREGGRISGRNLFWVSGRYKFLGISKKREKRVILGLFPRRRAFQNKVGMLLRSTRQHSIKIYDRPLKPRELLSGKQNITGSITRSTNMRWVSIYGRPYI